MEKEFVSYEQAVALKELGFDGHCIGFYFKDGNTPYLNPRDTVFKDGDICAPLKQQAFRWFRERYGLYCTIVYNHYDIRFDIISSEDDVELFGFKVSTYEEAEEACLDKLIEIAKESKQ